MDGFGFVTREAGVAYPRAPVVGRTPEQEQLHAFLIERVYAHRTDRVQGRRIGVAVDERTYEVSGLTGSRLAAADFGQGLTELPFEGEPDGTPQRRLVARKRVRYRQDDLSGLLLWGETGLLAIADESYSWALTAGLLDGLGDRLPASERDAVLAEAGYVQLDGDWWIPSGRVWHSPIPPGDGGGYVEDPVYASSHFYQPCGATDAFGGITRLTHDPHDMVPLRREDAVGSVVEVTEIDWQALAPSRVVDPNDNEVAMAYDALGRVRALARGGDTLAAPTASFAHVFGAPGYVHATLRERHGPDAPVQQARVFFDGLGREAQKKAQAASEGGTARMVRSGTIVWDAKGRPVRRHEPAFTDNWDFEPEPLAGVASTTFYDPAGRVVAVLHPDHSWEKVVIGPWEQAAWDGNDTSGIDDPRGDADVGSCFAVLPSDLFLPTWYSRQVAGDAAAQQAAAKTRAHASTPTRTFLDPLGRPFRSAQDNGASGLVETTFALDAGGRARTVTDALGRVTQRCDFDAAGRPIHFASPDGGERWALPDIAGHSIRTWDSRGFRVRRTFDILRRSVGVYVSPDGGPELLAEHTTWGDDPAAPGFADAAANNQRGRPVRVRDGAGEACTSSYDSDGNPVRTTRQFVTDVSTTPDWSAPVVLEEEIFEGGSTFDALGRLVEATTPAEPGRPASRIVPTYDDGGQLTAMDTFLRGAPTPTGHVRRIVYSARGQRVRIEHGNGSVTTCTYDPDTFRLTLLETARDTTTLQRLRYTYDAVGNVTRIADEVADTVYFANAVVPPQRDFVYDALYRLIEASGREHAGQQATPPTWDTPPFPSVHPEDGAAMRNYTEAYTFDAVGNLLTWSHRFGADGWSRTYAYEPGSNRLAETRLGAHVEAYVHDAHGNLTAMPHLPALVWDWKDQLQRLEKSGGGTVYHGYDAAGQRLRKVWDKGGEVEERIRLGMFEIVRTRIGGELRREWETLHVLDGVRREALVETKTIDTAAPETVGTTLHRYQLDDLLGTACVELDETAGIVSYEEFHPYGSTAFHSVRSGEEVPRKRFRFTGMERDEDSGLQYHSNRYYAPWIGRWCSSDPVGLRGGPNPFCYVAGNPLRNRDPSGLGPLDEARATEVLQAALDAYLNNANNTTVGSVGEAILEQSLHRAGLVVIKGPVTSPGPHKADVVAFDPETKELYFFDNKIMLKGTGSVRKADAFTGGAKKTEQETLEGLIEDARAHFDKIKSTLSEELQEQISAALDDVTPSNIKLFLANASTDEIGNLVERLGKSIAAKGTIGFLKIRGTEADGPKVRAKVTEARLARETSMLKRLGSAAPTAIGVALSAFLTRDAFAAAREEDIEYESTMAALGATPHFSGLSSARILTEFVSQEAVSELGSVGGGALFGFLLGAIAGVETGPGAVATGILGAFVGGFIGSWIGGNAGGYAFDLGFDAWRSYMNY